MELFDVRGCLFALAFDYLPWPWPSLIVSVLLSRCRMWFAGGQPFVRQHKGLCVSVGRGGGGGVEMDLFQVALPRCFAIDKRFEKKK